MSDYWKSTPKYWCKHCSAYVKDTPFERKQHENTGKHQGNLKRFLQGIQRDHAKNEREKDKAKAEVERLNRIAGVSSSSTAPLGATQSSRPSTSSSAPLSAADQKRQWAQLAEMGIAIPQSARIDTVMPGDWQVSSRLVETEPQSPPLDGTLNIGVRKRKIDGEEEEQEAGEVVVRTGWGSTTRRYPGQVPEDLDGLLAAPIFKKRNIAKVATKNAEDTRSKEELPDSIKQEPVDSGVVSTHLPTSHEHESEGETLRRDSETKGETMGSEAKAHTIDKPQETFVPIFKKRKAKSFQPTSDVHG